MKRREWISKAAALVAAGPAICAADGQESDSDRAERLHAAIMCLILNDTNRANLIDLPSNLQVGSPLQRIYAESPALYNAVRTNFLTIRNQTGATAVENAIQAFRGIFFHSADGLSTVYNPGAGAGANLYPGGDTHCPCTAVPGKCGFVERLI